MPRYDFRCEAGHVTEKVYPMGQAPPSILCEHADHVVFDGSGSFLVEARRVYQPPAAIHFHGGGFYESTRRALHSKRRPNPGDSLPLEFDSDTARIADAL